jgi:hypothetical protein
VRQPAPVKHAAVKLLGWLFLASGLVAAEPVAARFSHTLNAAEREEVALERLTSDQMAVLDALIRRDISNRGRRTESTPAVFSQRLTPDEFKNAGLTVFTGPQLLKLDGWVERYTAAGLARTLLAPPVYVARSRPVEPREDKAERKIHGTFTLQMGWGSGGYSERTGAVDLRMDDPKGRYSIQVGYAVTEIKNGSGYYRDDYITARPPLDGRP